MRRAPPWACLSLCLLLASELPALAQESSPEPAPSVTPAPSATSLPVRRDLYLDMPYHLGGFEPDIVITRGAEHFASLGPESPGRHRLDELLDAVGAGIEDMVSGYALVSQEDFFAFVVGIRIEGVEPGSLLPAYLPTLLQSLVEPTTSPGTEGGKDVLVITSIGEGDEPVDLYVYDEGDTIWMVQGPDDVAAIALRDLP
jgi:hypothetical protein